MSDLSNTTTLFAALADPTRLRLLHLMKQGEVCVCYLQGVLRTNQPKISRHLAFLRKACLVAGRRDGKWTHYRLAPMDPASRALLDQVLRRVGREAAARKDLERLKNICCHPERFGLANPAGCAVAGKRRSPRGATPSRA